MAKQVTVLGIEGDTLRGVRLDMVGEGYARGVVEAWPLVEQVNPEGEAESVDAPVEGGEGTVAEDIVGEDKPLARALRAAVKTFGTNEVVLSLPLSKFLVKTTHLPAEAREDLLGAAQLELDGISPFPDEELSPGAEIVAETDKDIVTVMAALPEAASSETSAALPATDAPGARSQPSARGWLRRGTRTV